MSTKKENNKLSKVEKRNCSVCSKEFKTTLADKLCCSDKCLSLSRALNLQKLYDDGKISPTKICDEAFYNITNLMKNLIATELIKKGYYKNGVKQDNFSEEELIDCYIYVMEHVFGTHIKKSGKQSYVKYDSKRIGKKTGKKIFLASFINSWTRGWCSLTIQTQENIYKINKHRILSLDEITETYTPEELIENEFVNGMSNNLEKEIFCKNVNKKVYDEIAKELSEELEDIYIDWN